MISKKRYGAIDTIRGFALINMIIYHALWDVVYIFGVDIGWYQSVSGYIWQQLICHTFIALSGFCFPLGKNKLKRGLTVFASSVIISVVTCFFSQESKILYGVLCLIGSAMLILVPFEKILNKINCHIGFSVFILMFVLTKQIPNQNWDFGNLFTAYLGFPGVKFYSSDYFPLIPWLFLYVSGFFMYKIFQKHNLLNALNKFNITSLMWVGRNSLLIYMLHQIVIYSILLIVFEVIK